MSNGTSSHTRKRRSIGNFVVLNEEELIHHVHLRPILYDRSLKTYRKASSRHSCWQEVGNIMGTTADQCRRRWRSLRDTFAKHYKQQNRTEDEHIRHKHRKWVFYDQMSFMIPYIDNASYEIDDHLIEEFGDNSEDAHSVHCETTQLNATISIPPTLETQDNKLSSSMADDHEHVQQNTVSVQATDFMPIQEESQVMVMINRNSDFNNGHTEHNAKSTIVECAETSSGHNYDAAEKFLLSCAPALRRLTNRQNAYARLQIQQILFDIEFGGRDCN